MTTSFRDRTFDERFKQMGDAAEGAFEEWATSTNLKYERFGFERPDFNMARLSPFMRYAPDFVTATNLVEVQGCGRDGTFKFKVEKIDALEEWNTHHPVELFLFDQAQKRNFLIDLSAVVTLTEGPAVTTGMFDGTKPWIGLVADELAEWQL